MTAKEDGMDGMPYDDVASEEGAPAAPPGRGGMLRPLAIVVAIIVVAAVFWGVFLHGADRSDWAYEMVQLEEANDLGYTGQGIRVAVIDTGLNVDHPAFKGVRIAAWKDLVNGRKDPYDDQGHGTAMTSIIAGQDDLPGGAPDVELIIVKVLDKDGVGTDQRIADGISFAIDPNGDGDYRDGASVISMSLGGRTRYLAEIIGTASQAAIDEAVDHGILVVAAAGNDGEEDDGDVASPGWKRDVVCVGAVDSDGRIAPFSSKGRNILKQPPNQKPEVVAPGVDIVSARSEGGYQEGSGTSQATAMVTASLAVALSVNPRYAHDGTRGGSVETVHAIKEALMDTAKKMTGQSAPHDDHYGYGMVQTVDLVKALRSGDY